MITTFNCGIGFCIICSKKNILIGKKFFKKISPISNWICFKNKKKNKYFNSLQMVKKNTCIFISGNGTNLKNLIQKSREYNFPINIDLIVSDKLNAPGIIYAKKNSIPFFLKNTKSSCLNIKY